MTIDWTTVLFEAVNFVVLVLIAIRFVYRPIRRILDQRQADIIARSQQTELREAEAAAVQAHFEGELAGIEQLAEQRVQQALAEARTTAEGIIAEVRASARVELDKAEAELGAARRRALERFRGEVLQLGTEAAQRIVRELGSAEIGLGFARRAAHALDEALGKDRLHGRVEVEVHHSLDLDPDALVELLRAELGSHIELHLREDEALIGGVRLHAQGFEIEASAGASLDAWYHSLAQAA